MMIGEWQFVEERGAACLPGYHSPITIHHSPFTKNMKPLTPAERRALKARAHHLQPVVMIGDAGLTPKVLREIDISLSSHELIKIRVLGDDREARAGMVEAICEPLAASPVQHIGKILVIFRPRPDDQPAAASSGGSPAGSAKKPAKTRGRKAPRRTKRSFQG